MTRYGYARVSSVDQNLSRQVEALIGAGVAYERIYKDKETGSRDGDRKEQKRLFKRMRRGDGHTGGRPRTPEARLDAAVRLYLAPRDLLAAGLQKALGEDGPPEVVRADPFPGRIVGQKDVVLLYVGMALGCPPGVIMLGFLPAICH